MLDIKKQLYKIYLNEIVLCDCGKKIKRKSVISHNKTFSHNLYFEINFL